MATRETAPAGAPCWIDLLTSDPQGSREFYGTLFGWTATEPVEEFGGYFQFLKDGVSVGGCMAKMQPDLPDMWSVYLNTDDAQKTAEKVAAAGGVVHAEPIPVGDLGTMAHALDPGGANIGIWQPNTFHGFGVLEQHGTPGWFELHTHKYCDSLNFYRGVFGWNTRVESNTEEFRYSVMQDGDSMYAGVFDRTVEGSEEAPGLWSVYFAVDDADAALAQVTELGGTILIPAEDTPYGRLAQAADPTGATFKFVSNPAGS